MQLWLGYGEGKTKCDFLIVTTKLLAKCGKLIVTYKKKLQKSPLFNAAKLFMKGKYIKVFIIVFIILFSFML